MFGAGVPRLIMCISVVAVLFSIPVQSAVVITIERHAVLVALPDPPGPVDLYGAIANTGTEELNLTGRLNTDQPDAWLPAGICIGDACFPSDTPFAVQLAPGAEDTFHVSLFPFETRGKGFYQFVLTGEVEGDSTDIELLAGTSAILVDDDGGDDFESFLEPILLVEELGFLTWNQALEPLTDDELELLEHVVWLTGNMATPLSETETALIGSFLNSGGKVILTGENILEGDAAQVLGEEFLGAEVSSTSVASRQIHGVADGPIPESVMFDIAGGVGADNQIAPDGLETVGAGRATLEYESGEIAAVRRIISGAGRSVVCGFGLEAVSDPDVLETVLSSLLEWVDSLGSSDVPPTVAELAIDNVFPNPSNGTIQLALSMPNGVSVDISLSDLAGRRVERLYRGLWNRRTVRLPAVPNGAYFIIVTVDGNRVQTPIVVLGE